MGVASAFRPPRCLAALADFAIVALLAGAGIAPAEPADSDSSGAPGLGHHNVFAWPVYFRSDSAPGRSVRVYGPVTVESRAPGYRGFYPVWPITRWRRWDSGRRDWDLFYPFVTAGRDPERGRWAVGLLNPLLSIQRIDRPEHRRFQVAPFYLDDRRASGQRLHALMPFFHHESDPVSAEWQKTYGFLFIPQLSLFRHGRHGASSGWEATPLFWGYESPTAHYVQISPWISFLATHAENDTTRVRVIAPVWASYRRDAPHLRVTSSLLLPFWYSYRRDRDGTEEARDRLFLPVYGSFHRSGKSGDSRVDVLLPFYGRLRTPEREILAALPTYWSYRSPRLRASGVWPLYGKSMQTMEDSSTRTGGFFLWPVVTWKNGNDYRRLGVLPLWYSVRDGDSRLTVLPPVYWHQETPGAESRVLFPFYGSRTTPTSSLRVVLPWYESTTGSTTTKGVFPIWQRKRGHLSGSDYVLPVWYHRWDEEGNVRLAGNLLWVRGGSRTGFGVLPFYYRMRGAGEEATLVGPLYRRRGSDGSHRTVVFPLSWYDSGPARRRFVLLPLLSGCSRSADGRSGVTVLWPLYRRRVSAPDERVDSVLWWLFRDERHADRRRDVLQPLYSYERSPDSTYVSALGGLLFSYARERDRHELRVLFVPIRRWTS
jgi:hypothetical protein